jgi:amino acid permease
MGRSEIEFWSSSFIKVVTMIDMYADELMMKAAAMKEEPYTSKYFSKEPEVNYVKSMKEIPGFY